MNSRGQFWSLDVVLAAAIFTLAIGLILSSSELSIFYGQQERNSRQLLSEALLGSNNLVSRSDFLVQFTPPECYGIPDGDPNRCNFLGSTSICGDTVPDPDCDVLDVFPSQFNARCGPNAEFKATFPPHVPGFPPAPSLTYYPRGWLYDNELSSLENCIIDSRSSVRPPQLGLSSDFYIDMNALLSDGSTLRFLTPNIRGNPYLMIQRRMLIFPFHPSAGDLRECMDGLCPQYLTDLNFRVWGV